MKRARDLICLLILLALIGYFSPPSPRLTAGERDYQPNQTFQLQLEAEMKTKAQEAVD